MTFIDVKQRVEKLKHEHYQALHMNTDELLALLARVVRFDPRRLVDKAGNLLPLHKLPDDVALALDYVTLEERTMHGHQEQQRCGHHHQDGEVLGD